MTKETVLAQITKCEQMLEEMITSGSYTRRTQKKLEKWRYATKDDLRLLESSNVNSDDLYKLQHQYQNLEYKLHELDRKKTRHKVTEIVPEEKQSKKTKKSRGIVTGVILSLSALTLAGAIIYIIYFVKNNKQEEKPKVQTPEDQIEELLEGKSEDELIEIIREILGEEAELTESETATESEEMTTSENDAEFEELSATVDSVDIEDFEQLMLFSEAIYNAMPEGSEMTIEDIMYAIRLANFDTLNDKAVFKDRDEVCAAAYFGGQIINAFGVDSVVQTNEDADIYVTDEQMMEIILCATNNELSTEDFASVKTDKGYNIYKLCELCIKNMYKDDAKNVLFARVLNDIVARFLLDFSICVDCPISTHYVIIGMFNDSIQRNFELTSGQTLGPIYGDGTRIDGTYGYMCIEELAAYLQISHDKGEFVGNPENILFTIVIDENITCYRAEELALN